MIQLRAAGPADGTRLMEIDRVAWSWNVAPVPLRPPDVDFFARNAPENVIVAEDAGHLLGYVTLRPPTALESNRHVLQIAGLAVDPARHRQGIGRSLIEAAIEGARLRGARRLTLRVLGPNAAAQALYRSCGFDVEGVLREEFFVNGRFVDDVLMARRLT